MIGRLRGVVEFIGEDYLILDVNGVGYRVFCSGKTLMSVDQGTNTAFLIETNVREDRIHLYGFLTELDKVFYNELCKINGVGNKVTLKIMSIMSADDIILAVNSGDKTLFTQVPGIGPKLGQRIATELKGSINKVMSKLNGEFVTPLNNSVKNTNSTQTKEMTEDIVANNNSKAKVENNSNSNSGLDHDKIKDAVSALENLGYKRNSIYPVVMSLVKDRSDITLESLITESLKELSVF